MAAENWGTHWTTYEDANTDRGIVHDVCNGSWSPYRRPADRKLRKVQRHRAPHRRDQFPVGLPEPCGALAPTPTTPARLGPGFRHQQRYQRGEL
ncbi:hypothetical protein ACJ7VE_33780 [Streptomyces sp. PB17]|uniref:hypothetical protein n=1 Tax=Streptomyces sp. PB17 TaxID=3384158 RepID=UPI0038B4C626